MIDALVKNASVTLIALAVLAFELVLVAAWWWRGTIALVPAIANILSGAMLVLALRAALLDQSAAMVALWLGLGFLAHLVDLLGRTGRTGAPVRGAPPRTSDSRSATLPPGSTR